jgi:DNA-binding CsgD family transcriptional regulator
VNLASRLCDEARGGQVFISQPAFAAVEQFVEAERLPDLTLKGLSKPVPGYSLASLKESRATFPGGLTAREAEILRLLAAGASSREIGERLFLSVRTVERHISNAYLKIGAHGRAEATAWAIRNGLLDSGAK